MVPVFPGVALTRAKDLRFKILLIKEDLPTFDFPENTISGTSDGGN